MKRDIQSQAKAAGDRFARHRTRMEEAEESELGAEIRAREEEPDSEDEAADPGLGEPSAES
jgi:hypothetical protein